MTSVFIAWQDFSNRKWLPVGRLSFDQAVYRFVFTRGAEDMPDLAPFGHMRNLHAIYESEDLFSLFANRIMSKKRPEYKEFLRWLGIAEGNDDPMTLLARSGGIRATDPFLVFSSPVRQQDNTYRVEFFSHRLREVPQTALARIDELGSGEASISCPTLSSRRTRAP